MVVYGIEEPLLTNGISLQIARITDKRPNPAPAQTGAARKPVSGIIFLPALLSGVIVLLAWGYTEAQNQKIEDQRLRAEVRSMAGQLGSDIESRLNSDLQLVQGLVAVLSTEPGMDQRRFAQLAESIFTEGRQLRNVAAAPDMIVSLIYPVEGNEGAIGLDYNKTEAQRAPALKARDSGSLILAGPVDLVQGGQAFIGRYPVFSAEGGTRRFWGIVSAVIDLEKLYVESGLKNPDLAIEVALVGKDALGAAGEQFYGPADLLQDTPVRVGIALPNGSWLLAARPRDGWDQPANDAWAVRLLFMLAGGMIVGPMVLVGALYQQRRRYINELSSRQGELDTLSRRYLLALETSQTGVWEYDHDTRSIIWDERMNDLYAYPRQQRVHQYLDWASRVHPEDRKGAVSEFLEAIRACKPLRSVFRLLLPDGSIRHIRAIARVEVGETGATRAVGVNWDVSSEINLQDSLEQANRSLRQRNSDLQDATDKVEFLALHDPLTELPNRRYLDRVLATHAGAYEHRNEHAGVLQIDLDGFKITNDTFGHPAGDKLLVDVAGLLRETVGAEDFVARVGGDEFVVLLRRADGAAFRQHEELEKLARKILLAVQKPVRRTGRIGASIGIASDAFAATSPRSLLRDADIALCQAKLSGRNQFKLFDGTMRQRLDREASIAAQLERALKEGQIEPYYQPQFNAETLELSGVEALARWNHPTDGVLRPEAFLPAAKAIGLDDEIDKLILGKALSDIKTWKDPALILPRVSLNLSAKRVASSFLLPELKSLQIDPGTISFELVESIFMDDADDTLSKNVAGLKSLGIDIEIDDFGTGFASIVGLLKLEPRRLKIDKQLVGPIVESDASRRVVSSMIEIGNTLGIEVIAEGVETPDHIKILQSLRCHALQGFAFGMPMQADVFADFLMCQSRARARDKHSA